jgi:predicted NAD/FAD-binding protein
MVPLVSCVWSCPPHTALEYPARSLFTFLEHHGALSVKGSPQWRTVVGGSRTYVERAVKELSATELSTPVRAVHRHADGVSVRDDSDDVRRFDAAVVATHADQALALLADPTPKERSLLGAFGGSTNETIMHTDPSLLPRAPRARASWNYLLEECDSHASAVRVSYHMNRLHRLDEPVDYVVTLNADGRVPDDRVLARMTYRHPVYTEASVRAQAHLPVLNDGTLAFAGAWQGWGFHEDGCASGVRAAESLGCGW